MSDYAKGVLTDAVLRGALAQARASDRMVIADPKRADFAAYRGATVLTPNEHEVRLATQIEAADDTEADRAGRRALETTGGEAVLVTRSAKGLTLVRRDCRQCICRRAPVKSPMCRAPATRWWRRSRSRSAPGAPLPEAAMLANITAGISVGKQGTATVSRDELLGMLHLEDLVATDRKIATREEAVAARRRVARTGAAGRLRQRMLRPDPSRPHPPADRGTRTVRSARWWR